MPKLRTAACVATCSAAQARSCSSALRRTTSDPCERIKSRNAFGPFPCGIRHCHDAPPGEAEARGEHGIDAEQFRLGADSLERLRKAALDRQGVDQQRSVLHSRQQGRECSQWPLLPEWRGSRGRPTRSGAASAGSDCRCRPASTLRAACSPGLRLSTTYTAGTPAAARRSTSSAPTAPLPPTTTARLNAWTLVTGPKSWRRRVPAR